MLVCLISMGAAGEASRCATFGVVERAFYAGTIGFLFVVAFELVRRVSVRRRNVQSESPAIAVPRSVRGRAYAVPHRPYRWVVTASSVDWLSDVG